MSEEEQRKHARIETSLECTVVAGEVDFPAKVANLSRGGAGLLAAAGKVEAGALVMLLVEHAQGGFSLALPARVLRAAAYGDEELYGLQFEAVPPDVDDDLVKLLKVLTDGRGSGRRGSPRVASRVRVKCKSAQTFAATLNDLSKGGLSVRCPRPVEPGSRLGVQFGVEDHPELVSVAGEVLRVGLQEDGSFLVSMKFDPPTAEDQEHVRKLLQVLLGLDAP